MAHLLGERAPAEVVRAVALVGLAEQRVEGLARAVAGGGVRGGGEGRHVGELLARVLALRRLVQALGVLEVLGEPLQERQRLAEVHLRGEW